MYVPIGGKKLLTFMDDFNMPAKDTFGSQPPLELIKHWIDYSFWYDRQKQTVKQIKVTLAKNCKAKRLLQHSMFPGYVPVGCHGPSRWGEDGDL